MIVKKLFNGKKSRYLQKSQKKKKIKWLKKEDDIIDI